MFEPIKARGEPHPGRLVGRSSPTETCRPTIATEDFPSFLGLVEETARKATFAEAGELRWCGEMERRHLELGPLGFR